MKRIFVSGAPRRKAPLQRACVAAVGVFDGVHRGHQKVIARAVMEARRLGVRSVVVTFHPHPVAVLHPARFTPYITTLEHRLQLIEALGVDTCIVVKFSKQFASVPPVQFVRDLLARGLGARKVVIGSDFHFGRGRKGSVSLLEALGHEYGFSVEHLEIVKNKNMNIKSTYIKELISCGNLSRLKALLSRPYSFLGEVERGDGRGRGLGYPTANFKQENVIILPSGIYYARADWDDKTCNGLCYIGRRPTFKNARARVIQELHLLDHHADLYGKKIRVEFLRRLREDRTFSDEKELVLQIGRDVRKARGFFLRHP